MFEFYTEEVFNLIDKLDIEFGFDFEEKLPALHVTFLAAFAKEDATKLKYIYNQLCFVLDICREEGAA